MAAFRAKGPARPVMMDESDEEAEAVREEIVAIEDNAIQGFAALRLAPGGAVLTSPRRLNSRPRGPRVIPLPALPAPVPYRPKKTSAVAAIAQAGQAGIGDKFNIDKMELGPEEAKVPCACPGAALVAVLTCCAQKEVVYGLVVRKAEGEGVGNGGGVELPLLLRNRNAALDDIADEEAKFKADVAGRPDEAGADAYADTPVEEYGEALMRGMGWAPGGAIGLSNPAVVQPIEYVARHHRLGLGATPKAVEAKEKRIVKPGESREPRPVMVVQRDADGHQRHYRTLDEKLVPLAATTVREGAAVAVTGGPHQGVLGRVARLQAERAVVRLANGEEVEVQPAHLVLAAHYTPPAAPAAGQAAKRKADEADGGAAAAPRGGATAGAGASGWVRPGLLVRIVSKSLKEGRYYQKKARVVDVPTLGECALRLADDGKLVEAVPERALQTVVPRTGQRVMILRGSQTGRTATLVEVNDKKEEAVVQTADELDLRAYAYDEICALA